MESNTIELNQKKDNTTNSKIENFTKIKEEDVGIIQYMNPSITGFKCILKHRYSDFIVNEIDNNGKVVWIKENVETVISPQPEIGKSETKKDLTEDDTKNILKNEFIAKNLLNEDDYDKLYTFIINYIYKQNCINDEIVVKYIEDKIKRTQFHEAIRTNFPFLDSVTDNKCLKVTYLTQKSLYKRRKVLPDTSKPFLQFSLLKRNIDTVGAINYISRQLHIPSKNIKFAGNKDKRGITTQRISVTKTLPNDVIRATKGRNWNKNIEIGNFSFTSEEIRLGLLKGNQFSVALRFIEIDNIDNIENIIKSINQNGFINYFGMQRFGVGAIPTYLIGKYVIKKKWKEAFMGIVNTDHVKDALKQINLTDIQKDLFDLTDFDKQKSIISDILKIIPKFLIEFKLLTIYSKTGKNSYQSSFKSLNRQLQVLYPHSYQSYIWNFTVTFRIEKYGKKLILGDIVKKHQSLYMEKNQEEDCGYEYLEEDDNNNAESSKVNNEENKIEKGKGEKIFTDNFEYITEENINKYSFDDLVIPIVGYEVFYPKNETKNYIVDLLAKDELEFKDFEYNCVHFNSTGYFRKVIEKPISEMTYDIVHHDNPDEDLQSEYYNINGHPHLNGKKYTSLRLIFQLPQSTYATMLFRELTKHSSSGTYQANLSLNLDK